MKTWFDDLKAAGRKLYRDLNARTGGVLRILKRTFDRFSEDRSSQAAAGLAYYIFFSLFPLLLVLVAVASSLLQEEAAFAEALDFIAQAIPVSRELIERNLRTAMERRTAVGSISLVSALWSATNAFATMTQHINRAWKQAQPPGFLRKRIFGFAIVGILIILLLFSIIASTALQFVPRWIESTLGLENAAVFGGRLWPIITRLIPPLLLLALLTGLYRGVPNTDVRWRAAVWGAGVATVAWEGVKIGFTTFLRTGLLRYDLVYGSLAAVVALQFWIYLGALIMLVGAYLSAAVHNELEGS